MALVLPALYERSLTLQTLDGQVSGSTTARKVALDMREALNKGGYPTVFGPIGKGQALLRALFPEGEPFLHLNARLIQIKMGVRASDQTVAGVFRIQPLLTACLTTYFPGASYIPPETLFSSRAIRPVDETPSCHYTLATTEGLVLKITILVGEKPPLLRTVVADLERLILEGSIDERISRGELEPQASDFFKWLKKIALQGYFDPEALRAEKLVCPDLDKELTAFMERRRMAPFQRVALYLNLLFLKTEHEAIKALQKDILPVCLEQFKGCSTAEELVWPLMLTASEALVRPHRGEEALRLRFNREEGCFFVYIPLKAIPKLDSRHEELIQGSSLNVLEELLVARLPDDKEAQKVLIGPVLRQGNGRLIRAFPQPFLEGHMESYLTALKPSDEELREVAKLIVIFAKASVVLKVGEAIIAFFQRASFRQRVTLSLDFPAIESFLEMGQGRALKPTDFQEVTKESVALANRLIASCKGDFESDINYLSLAALFADVDQLIIIRDRIARMKEDDECYPQALQILAMGYWRLISPPYVGRLREFSKDHESLIIRAINGLANEAYLNPLRRWKDLMEEMALEDFVSQALAPFLSFLEDLSILQAHEGLKRAYREKIKGLLEKGVKELVAFSKAAGSLRAISMISQIGIGIHFGEEEISDLLQLFRAICINNDEPSKRLYQFNWGLKFFIEQQERLMKAPGGKARNEMLRMSREMALAALTVFLEVYKDKSLSLDALEMQAQRLSCLTKYLMMHDLLDKVPTDRLFSCWAQLLRNEELSKIPEGSKQQMVFALDELFIRVSRASEGTKYRQLIYLVSLVTERGFHKNYGVFCSRILAIGNAFGKTPVVTEGEIAHLAKVYETCPPLMTRQRKEGMKLPLLAIAAVTIHAIYQQLKVPLDPLLTEGAKRNIRQLAIYSALLKAEYGAANVAELLDTLVKLSSDEPAEASFPEVFASEAAAGAGKA